MIANYKQKLSMKISKKQRAIQITSIVVQVLSLGFIIVGFVVDYYYYIGFLLTYGLGVAIYQIYYSTTKEYEYVLTENQLVFYKNNIRMHAKLILGLNLSEIKSIKIFSDLVKEGELVLVDNVSRKDAKEIEYEKDGKTNYIVFAPDEYMVALLEDRLGGKLNN